MVSYDSELVGDMAHAFLHYLAADTGGDYSNRDYARRALLFGYGDEVRSATWPSWLNDFSAPALFVHGIRPAEIRRTGLVTLLDLSGLALLLQAGMRDDAARFATQLRVAENAAASTPTSPPALWGLCPIDIVAHGIVPLGISFDQTEFSGLVTAHAFHDGVHKRYSVRHPTSHDIKDVAAAVHIIERHGLRRSDLDEGLRKRMASFSTSHATSVHGVMADHYQLLSPTYARLVADKIRNTTKLNRFRGIQIARADATEEEMVDGLVSVCETERRQISLLPRIGRAPTINELRLIRKKGIVDILWSMPLEILEEMKGSYRIELEAYLARHLDNVDAETLMNCLNDHQFRTKGDRFDLDEYVSRRTGEWLVKANRHVEAHRLSVETRSRMWDLTESPATSAAYVLCALAEIGAYGPASVRLDGLRDFLHRHHPYYDITHAEATSYVKRVDELMK